MSDSLWVHESVGLLRDAERARQRAEQDIADAQARLAAAELDIDAIRLTIAVYRVKHSLPNAPIPDASTHSQYAQLGPSAMVEQWADSHDGEFVLKDAASEMLKNGLFPNYRKAYNTLRTTVTRKRHFQQVGPGRFRKLMNGRQLAVPIEAIIQTR